MSRLLLDAGAVLALARGDQRTRAFIERAIRERQDVILPTPVLAQVHRGGRERARIDRVLKAVDVFLPTSAVIARRAGELLGHADMSDAVDGIVAAEALAGAPATVVTSDPKDLNVLVRRGADPDRVLIFGV